MSKLNKHRLIRFPHRSHEDVLFFLLLSSLWMASCMFYMNRLWPQNTSASTIITNVDSPPKHIMDTFGNSLFCPINHSSDRRKYDKVLQDLYQFQFNSTCDMNGKYYIMSSRHLRKNRGFISFIDHEYTPPFFLSIYLNRTYIFTPFDDKHPWVYLPKNGKTIAHLCSNQTGMKCIFKPVSNCSPQQISKIIQNAEKNESLFVVGIDTKHKYHDICGRSARVTPERFAQWTENYTVILHKFECRLFWANKFMNRPLIDSVIRQRKYNVNYYEYSALIWSVLMRLQDPVRKTVNEIVKQSLVKYKWRSKRNTISLVIRGSDKCKNTDEQRKFRNAPEMNCFPNVQFLNVAEVIRYLMSTEGEVIDSIIITSEDDRIMDYMMNREYHNKTVLKYSWNLIRNDADILQSCGLVQDLDDDTKRDEIKMYKMMISMLSTIKLQMHSKYYVIQKQSNWAHAIWTLSTCMHCNVLQDTEDRYANNDDSDQRLCVDLRNKGDNQTMTWDPKLFVHNDKHSVSLFAGTISHAITQNGCFRSDRFDE